LGLLVKALHDEDGWTGRPAQHTPFLGLREARSMEDSLPGLIPSPINKYKLILISILILILILILMLILLIILILLILLIL